MTAHCHIYLDNSTTAKPSEKAVAAMKPYLTSHFGLPSAPHQKGQELYPALKEAYETLYRFLGASRKDTLILTSCGAEAVNQVFLSVYHKETLRKGKNQYLFAQNDEAASIMKIEQLEEMGCVGRSIPINDAAKVTVEAIADLLTPRTALLSLSYASGLTGVIQPIQEIAHLCHERGVLLHLEATHVIGKLFFDLQEISPHFLTFNGDQIHAPRGSGILYAKEGVELIPLICGSADQGGARAGGLNMASLVSLATAAKEAQEAMDFMGTEIAFLRNLLEQEIIKGFPQASVCYKDQERLPHCTTLLFPRICSEALLLMLNQQGLFATMGGGSFQKLALVLQAAHIDDRLADSALSFSLSRYTTEEEIIKAAKIISQSAHLLCEISKHVWS